MWMDTGRRVWIDDILRATGLSRANTPNLYEGSEITGKLSTDVAKKWNMSRALVVGGDGENEAGAVGAGLVKPVQAMLSLGTSGVYFVVSTGFSPSVISFLLSSPPSPLP
uniref:Xylulokinase, putative n=1 Tax=Leishmania guyanensis TaxID=5670 RepID=A0A1E1J6Y6_LEIGU|nr:xylulokinase, putative [Leishmania guyanensis]